jgi:hypothetical protein
MSPRHLVKSCNRLVTFALRNFGLFTLNRKLDSLLFINSVIQFIYLWYTAEETTRRYKSATVPVVWTSFRGEQAKAGSQGSIPSRARSSALAGVGQPAAHCASFPIGPPAGAPRSAVLAGKFSNRRPVVQINPGGFEHIACRFRSARCHRQPLPQAPEQSHSPSLVNLGAWAASGCVTVRCVAASSGARQSDVKRRSALPVRRQRA